jgi:hypothetical protein
MEIKAEPKSKNPIYPPTISHVARFPKKDRMMGYMQVIRRVKTNTETAAKYLPSTIPVKEVGLVNNSWSVLCLLSSGISLMVRMGTTIKKIKVMLPSTAL